jgi:hypothetical protein
MDDEFLIDYRKAAEVHRQVRQYLEDLDNPGEGEPHNEIWEHAEHERCTIHSVEHIIVLTFQPPTLFLDLDHHPRVS